MNAVRILTSRRVSPLLSARFPKAAARARVPFSRASASIRPDSTDRETDSFVGVRLVTGKVERAAQDATATRSVRQEPAAFGAHPGSGALLPQPLAANESYLSGVNHAASGYRKNFLYRAKRFNLTI